MKTYNTIEKHGNLYYVFSEKKTKAGVRKRLGGPFRSKAAAEKRLRQVEFFKHKG